MDGSIFYVGTGFKTHAGSEPGSRDGSRSNPGEAAGVPAVSMRLPHLGLDAKALSDWIESLRALGVRQAGPALVMALEQLRRAALPPASRVAILRLLKSALLKTCKALPKPWRAARQAAAAVAALPPQRGATLEQRLYRLMFQNLNLALTEFDTFHPVANPQRAEARCWLQRNLFRFCARQLRYAALWSCPLPPDTWRDLHALHLYLRLREGTWGAGPVADRPRGTDAEGDYKALLLFGLATETAPQAARQGAVTAGLAGWAAQTSLGPGLDDARSAAGAGECFVVELAADAPPRRCAGPLGPQCRAWILLPPPSFLKQLAADPADSGATANGSHRERMVSQRAA